MKVGAIEVKGKPIDEQTRCVHYHSPLDIIALKFRCCGSYYPCFYCHEETTDHLPQRWRSEDAEEKAILCGACQTELTIAQYRNSGYTCPACSAVFNPGCHKHDHLYFEPA